MTRPHSRHYSEEELLVHMLGEGSAETSVEIQRHVETCNECAAVLGEQRELFRLAREWSVPEPDAAVWESQKARILEAFRGAHARRPGAGLGDWLAHAVRNAWDYALENPLPTLGYIAAAVAFASERTITVFRLDRILPATGELFEILKQAF